MCFADTGVECVPLSVMRPSETLPFLTNSIFKLVFVSTLCVFVHISKLFSKLANQTIKISILVGYIICFTVAAAVGADHADHADDDDVIAGFCYFSSNSMQNKRYLCSFSCLIQKYICQ